MGRNVDFVVPWYRAFMDRAWRPNTGAIRRFYGMGIVPQTIRIHVNIARE